MTSGVHEMVLYGHEMKFRIISKTLLCAYCAGNLPQAGVLQRLGREPKGAVLHCRWDELRPHSRQVKRRVILYNTRFRPFRA